MYIRACVTILKLWVPSNNVVGVICPPDLNERSAKIHTYQAVRHKKSTVVKGLMEQSNREVMVHSFLPARSSYLRFTTVDRSVNENNHILIYVEFKNTVLLFYLLHCSFNIF